MKLTGCEPKENKQLRSYYFDNETINIIDLLSKNNKINKTQVVEFCIKQIYKNIMEDKNK